MNVQEHAKNAWELEKMTIASIEQSLATRKERTDFETVEEIAATMREYEATKEQFIRELLQTEKGREKYGK